MEKAGINMKKIEVKQNRKGNVLYIIGALVMSLVSLFLSDGSIIEAILGISLVIGRILKFVFIFGFVFFGYCFVFLMQRMKEGKPVLTVDKNGITDCSSLISFGLIEWKDIERIYIDGVMNNEFIEIEISNEDKYIHRLSFIFACLVKVNKKMGHQAVCITLHTTGISPHEIIEDIQSMYHFYKR